MRLFILCTICAVLLYGVPAGIRTDIGMFLQPLAGVGGSSYADVSFCIAVLQVVFGASQPFWGFMAMRKSNRLVLLIGVILFLSGLALMPFSSSLPLVFLSVGILMGLGGGAISFGLVLSSAITLVGEKKAMMLAGILNAASGMLSTCFSPVIAGLLAAGGLLLAALSFCIPAAILIPIVLFLTSKNQKRAAPEETDRIPLKDLLKEAFQNRTYRLLICGFSTCGFHMVIIEAHLYSQFLGYGMEADTAAWAFSVYGIATIFGALLSGWLSTVVPKGKLLSFYYGFRAFWVLFFLFLLPKTIITSVLFGIGLGMTGDATVSPTSGLVNANFRLTRVATLIGFLFLCHQIGAFISAWLGGVFLETFGSYTPIWLCDVGLCVFASMASFLIREKGVPG